MSIRSKWKSLSLVLLAFLILGASIPPIQSLSANLRISSTGTISYIPGTIGSNIWTADFETGDLSQFSDVDIDSGNLLEATPAVKYEGSYAMHLHKEEEISTAMGRYQLVDPTSAFHFSFVLNMGQSFETTSWVRLFELHSQSGKFVWMSVRADGDGVIVLNGEDYAFELNQNHWYDIDVYVSSGQAAIAFVYVDGALLCEIFGDSSLVDQYENPLTFETVLIGCVYSDDAVGSGDIYYDAIEINEWDPPELPPQSPESFFIYYPTTPKPNEEVTFYSYHSNDVDGDIITYQWNFGDGNTAEGQNVTHTFASEGIYSVRLTTTDNSGLSDYMTSEISVETRTPVNPVNWSLPLHVEGLEIMDANGNDVTLDFTGVAKMGLAYNDPSQGVVRETNPIYYEHDADLMAEWGIKLLRLDFNWVYYMTRHDYRETVKQWVDIVTSRGIIVIMDIHRYKMRGLTMWPARGLVRSPEFLWLCAEDAVLCLKAVTHDFLYNPMVVGVEINEFRPNSGDAEWDYQFKFDLTKRLAEEVHSVNPNLLVGIEIGLGGGGTLQTQYTSVRPYCKSIIDSLTNIVYMPHIYFCSGYGRRGIWSMYDEGNFVEGKAEMYDVLDNYYLSEQQYYGLPIVVTEWGSDGINGGEVVKDELAYFIEHNWGSSYWAWFRAGPVGDAYNMGLLCDDWETPSNSGEAFKQKLAELN